MTSFSARSIHTWLIVILSMSMSGCDLKPLWLKKSISLCIWVLMLLLLISLNRQELKTLLEFWIRICRMCTTQHGFCFASRCQQKSRRNATRSTSSLNSFVVTRVACSWYWSSGLTCLRGNCLTIGGLARRSSLSRSTQALSWRTTKDSLFCRGNTRKCANSSWKSRLDSYCTPNTRMTTWITITTTCVTCLTAMMPWTRKSG